MTSEGVFSSACFLSFTDDDYAMEQTFDNIFVYISQSARPRIADITSAWQGRVRAEANEPILNEQSPGNPVIIRPFATIQKSLSCSHTDNADKNACRN